MKHRSTTPVSSSFAAKASLVAMTILVATAGTTQFSSQALAARNFDSEILAKEKEAQKFNSEADRLGAVAGTLQEALNEISGHVSQIQTQINDSQRKADDLTAQIAKNEILIEKNRKTLGRILSDMYVDDQISPLEMLASSSSIGDFIDKQEQRTSLRTSLNGKIKEIKALQKKLGDDKVAVENVLKDQQSQRAQLAAKQDEQAKLVAATKNDQNAYAELASERNAQISKLREQQAAENLRRMQSSGWQGGAVPGPSAGNGGYPAIWANAPIDTYVDNWGLYSRECVSYVAWKLSSKGKYVPNFGGNGHAYQWPSTLSNWSQGSTPRAGAAAIMFGGPYGHVMYVESVNSDGTITVSDYNLGLDGLYRYYTRSASGLTYIYF